MFSRVIRFFDNLFLLWKSFLLIALVAYISYYIYVYMGLEAQSIQNNVSDVIGGFIAIILVFFLSSMNTALLSILIFQVAPKPDVVEVVFHSPLYIFLLGVSIVLFLILGFNFIKNFIKRGLDCLTAYGMADELLNPNLHLVFAIPVYLVNFILIVSLLGTEILFLIESFLGYNIF
ncbi:hypothetical protein [Helicobacter rodentium]|uniref:hypothetical protein n=1 Tax=Helicobacter rodentium TaxID=59617 RepID=UPI0023F4E0F3|nr:hypothetical protein [Helicobacter rodentium]